jgi:hypothetical protein
MTVPVRSSNAWMSRSRRATPSSGRIARSSALCARHCFSASASNALTSSSSLSKRQTGVKASLAHVLYLRRQLVPAPSTAQLDERTRVEERHLRRNPHELGQVQVEASVHVADQARAPRHPTSEGCERAPEARLAECARDGPREGRRDTRERLADVDVAPHRVSGAAFGETMAGGRTRLHNPGGLVVAGKLHVPRDRLELLEERRDLRKLRYARAGEGRLLGVVDGDFTDTSVANDRGVSLSRDH